MKMLKFAHTGKRNEPADKMPVSSSPVPHYLNISRFFSMSSRSSWLGPADWASFWGEAGTRVIPAINSVTAAIAISRTIAWSWSAVCVGWTVMLILPSVETTSGCSLMYSVTASTINSLFLLPSFSSKRPAWTFSSESGPHWSENRNLLSENNAIPSILGERLAELCSGQHLIASGIGLGVLDKFCLDNIGDSSMKGWYKTEPPPMKMAGLVQEGGFYTISYFSEIYGNPELSARSAGTILSP